MTELEPKEAKVKVPRVPICEPVLLGLRESQGTPDCWTGVRRVEPHHCHAKLEKHSIPSAVFDPPHLPYSQQKI